MKKTMEAAIETARKELKQHLEPRTKAEATAEIVRLAAAHGIEVIVMPNRLCLARLMHQAALGAQAERVGVDMFTVQRH